MNTVGAVPIMQAMQRIIGTLYNWNTSRIQAMRGTGVMAVIKKWSINNLAMHCHTAG